MTFEPNVIHLFRAYTYYLIVHMPTPELWEHSNPQLQGMDKTSLQLLQQASVGMLSMPNRLSLRHDIKGGMPSLRLLLGFRY